MEIETTFSEGRYNWKDVNKLVKSIEKLGWKVKTFGSLRGLRFSLYKDLDLIENSKGTGRKDENTN